MTETTLGVALWVATKWPGARVFPTDGKVPALKELGSVPWNEAATTDPDVLAGWFTGTHWGVGVTGILAIDCDTDNGWTATHEFGVDVLDGVRWFGNPDRRTYAFTQPDEPFGDGRWPGGEVKGSGYVVLPPSWHYAPDTCEVCVEGERIHHYAWDSQWQTLPALPASVESVLDGLVRRQHAGPVVEATDEQIEAWSTAGAPCRAVSAALADWADGMLADHPARHDLMAHAQMRLLRLGEQGHAGVAAALDTVWSGFLHSVEKDKARHRQAPDEWARAAKGAARRIVSEGLTDPLDKGCCAPEPGDEDAIFGATPLLSDLRQYARAHQVSPYALLGSCLARVVSETPHWFSLPERGSVNLFVALVGGPGVGKSTAHMAAGDYLVVDDPIALPIGQGTGEGLMSAFMELDPDQPGKVWRLRQPFPNVLMFVDEVDQMSAMNGRNGAIGDSVLRSLWSGAFTSTYNADTTRRRVLPAHSYRVALVMGVQPTNGNHLFGRDAMNSGTAQRWLCLPAYDHGLDVDAAYEPPASLLSWQRPASKMGGDTITFPPDVLAHVRRLRAKVRAEQASDDEAVESHAAYQHMKVAGALALLHGETEVTPDLWALAGALMEVSEATRDRVLAATAKDAKARAEAEGARAAYVEGGKNAVLVRTGADALGRLVARHAGKHAKGCTRRCLSQGMRRYRDVLDEVITVAVAGGLVLTNDGTHYRTPE